MRRQRLHWLVIPVTFAFGSLAIEALMVFTSQQVSREHARATAPRDRSSSRVAASYR